MVDLGYNAARLERGGVLARDRHNSARSRRISYREVLRALPYFRRRVGRPLLLTWGRLNAHIAQRTQAYVAAHAADFATHPLPPYAPELNPEEQCNHWVKHAMENALPSSVAELHALARRGFRRLQHHPELLRSFFDHAGLGLT